MQYTRFGSTGLIVSRVALGTMTFGAGFAPVNKVSQATATEIVARALDAGVNFFDTANQYAGGQSEEILGRALGPRRREVVVASKVGLRLNDETLLDAGLSARHVIASAEASLRRLGTDYLDLLQIHMGDPHTPLEETVRALDDLVRRGLVRYTGFCNLPAWEAALALGHQRAGGYARFVSAQMYYSLLGRDVEHDIVPFVQHAGLALLVWSPLAGGFLSGKYAEAGAGGAEDRRAGLDFPPIDRALGDRVVALLREIATPLGATPAQVALAWVLARPAVTAVILGASRPEQIADNLAAVDLAIPADALARLDGLTAPAPQYPYWMMARFPDSVVERVLHPDN